jgi:hypothetical protein
MATKKKTTFIDVELEWAEKQLCTWKDYIDANPIHELKDRIEWKPTARGGSMPMVIASIEQQGKFIQETMKNYLMLLKEVDIMREKEESKKTLVRGDESLSPVELGQF